MPVAPSPQHIISQDAQDQARTHLHHQPKRCTTCHGPISHHALPADVVCAACRTRSTTNASAATTTAAAAENVTRARRGSVGSSDGEGASPVVEVPLSSLEAQMGGLSVSATPTPTTTGAPPLRPKPDGAPPPAVRAPRGAAPTLEIQTSSLSPSSLRSPLSSTSSVSSNNHKVYAASPLLHTPSSTTLATVPELRAARYTPDPFCDITRLRVRPRGYYCLYPGATFHGLQQSGKSSYDVHVTILDVDMDASTLCGYLRIRGLTDDWPEMTTYFDAELIGATHGFLTARWGASEKEDLLHWSRFPAFAKVKGEMAGPRWTLPERDRGAVFMRWKERFLVPDHRVQDITGASFAGFYYICVDFNPHTRGQPLSPAVSEDAAKHAAEGGVGAPAGAAGAAAARAGRRTSVSAAAPPVSRTRSSSTGTARVLGSGAATMRGFYYHRNSDPYQELTLQHVTETAVSEFEFR